MREGETCYAEEVRVWGRGETCYAEEERVCSEGGRGDLLC